MIGLISMGRSGLDIGIRWLGVGVAALLGVTCLSLIGAPGGVPGLALIFAVILFWIALWSGLATVRFAKTKIVLRPVGIDFYPSEEFVPWERIRRVESHPVRMALTVVGDDEAELGEIPYSMRGFADGLVRLLRELGERSTATEGPGRMIIERTRPFRALLLSVAMMVILPGFGFASLGLGRGLWFLVLVAGAGIYALYRRSGTRRLELDLAGLRWRSREESGEFAWSELLLVGLRPMGQEYVSGPALVRLSREGQIVLLPMDDVDIGAVASFLRVSAPRLWEGAFLHGRPLVERIKALSPSAQPQ